MASVVCLHVKLLNIFRLNLPTIACTFNKINIALHILFKLSAGKTEFALSLFLFLFALEQLNNYQQMNASMDSKNRIHSRRIAILCMTERNTVNRSSPFEK